MGIPTKQVTALTSFRWEGVSYREGEELELPETKLAEFVRLSLVAEAGVGAPAKPRKKAAKKAKEEKPDDASQTKEDKEPLQTKEQV